MKNIQFDHLGQRALDIMENTDQSLFLTGKAGTGKSTMLRHFIDNTSKETIVLASTGVAAINIGGSTIHKFFRFSNNISLDDIDPLTGQKLKILKNLDTIVIDEVSMVRADLLDAMDKCIRISLGLPEAGKPFGGKQIVFIGDLYQLPPVITSKERKHFNKKYDTEYFFSSSAYQNLDPFVISLQKVYRQEDKQFKAILNKIRLGICDQSDIDKLNENVISGLNELDQGTIVLTTTNKRAKKINMRKLKSLSGKKRQSQANVSGQVPQNFYPTEVNLEFKKGAQVIMLNNTDMRSNGSIGQIVGWQTNDDGEELIKIQIDGNKYLIDKFTWRITKMNYNEKTGHLENKTIGKFIQYPFKLAWAITIHKSQGLTFDKLAIDFGKYVFAKGQAYVALSRASNLKNLSLFRPVRKKDIRVDKRVLYFMGDVLRQQKKRLIKEAMKKDGKVKFNYIKSSGEVSTRTVSPDSVGQESYNGYEFDALKGHCHLREAHRTFNLKKIFDLSLIDVD